MIYFTQYLSVYLLAASLKNYRSDLSEHFTRDVSSDKGSRRSTLKSSGSGIV